MLMNVPCIVDLEQMRAQRQQVADRNNLAENRRRRYKNYVVGDEVLIITHKPTKMAARATGPFVITQVHVNGTVTIQRRPNVFERISIRRIKPYIRRA
jgi:putative ribosome biogenesis GTPase RsgA